MKKHLPIKWMVSVFVLQALVLVSPALALEPVEAVNPFIGTDANDHAFPGAASPFGMVQLSPDTGGNHGLYLMSDWKWCAGYHYSDPTIMGFSHLHRSGMGVGDWGDILVMPGTGPVRVRPGEEDKPEGGYRSRFSHETEEAEPGYYAVTLDDYRVRAELTVGPRSGFHRYTFPASDSSHIIIDLGHGLGDEPLGGRVRIAGNDTIIGTRTSTGVVPFQKVHFCAKFSRPFDSFGAWNGLIKIPGARISAGTKIGAFVGYKTEEGEAILVKVGISYTSEQAAAANLESDVAGWDFDLRRQQTRNAWAEELNRIQIIPSPLDPPEVSRARERIFYTALYHAHLFPALFGDASGDYSPIGNKPGAKKKAEGFDYYSDYSVWDTFRAQMPLVTLLHPKRMGDMLETIVTQYRDSGRLPSTQPFGNNHTDCMTGEHLVCVMLDARLKGITNFDYETAYEGFRKNAVTKGYNVIPMLGAGIGRWGLGSYMKRGYVAADFALPPKNPLFIAPYAYNQGTSRTLEYSYNDACLAKMARELGKDGDAAYFDKRSQNYRNVFDPGTGFMRGKKASGKWMNEGDFDPTAYYAYYTEGNSWQWTFSVFHDVRGLIDLMGGREAFNNKLDEFFGADTATNAYELFSVHIGGQIGQYAHGNEPSHHIAYLYDYSGRPWRTQELARKIMDEFYHDAPQGLAGNEDMGQMSAWYVWSALGLYPFRAGIYTIGSPLFAEAAADLGDGRVLTVVAENASRENKYVQSVTFNGAPLNRPWLDHSEIAPGGRLVFVMGPEPNKAWGSAPEAAPPAWE